MNRFLAAGCLLLVYTQHAHAHVPGLSSLAYVHNIASYTKQAVLASASIAATYGIMYYFFLPIITQTASTVGTALIDQTALLIKEAAQNTTPYAAGAFLIDYGLNVSGLPTRQASSRRYAAAALLYLIEKKMLKR